MPSRSRTGYIVFSLCLALLGVLVAYEGVRLSLGTLNRIGPGFFPLGLGVLIAVLSLAAILERPSAALERFNLRGLVLVSGALLFFAVTVERLGLIVAVAGVVIFTSLAQGRAKWTTVLLVTAFLCAVGYGLFVMVLRLPLRPLPDLLPAFG